VDGEFEGFEDFEASERSEPGGLMKRTGLIASIAIVALACIEASASAQTTIDWSTNAIAFRGRNGQTLDAFCPPGGSPGSVWGTDMYSDDSSVCTAAVHAGAIGFGGGSIRIQIQPGMPSYVGSSRNGVSSQNWGAWTGSFTVLGGRAAPPTGASWSQNAEGFRGQPGPITIQCPGGGSPGSVWGTDYYSTDSSICTAAVHAGRITLARGGSVTIYLFPGLPSYPASVRNGISTSSWGSYGASFGFTPTPPMAARTIDWSLDGADVVTTGSTTLVFCPAGSASSIWGTDVYTSDSSVCTAAVHAGVIGWGGGPVMVVGLPGQGGYPASMRNGVASRSWGSWGASFAVSRPR